jgi:hypothetical protein
MSADWAPTPRLRWVEREVRVVDTAVASPPNPPKGKRAVAEPKPEVLTKFRVLQCWWAPNVPSYMIDPRQGQWEDVPLGVEAP